MTPVEGDVDGLQRDVQRKLGRCLLRLQQYERLLRAVVAGSSVGGPIEQMHAARVRRETNVSNQSLGVLVGMFTGRYLTPTPVEGEPLPSGAGFGGSSQTGLASIRFTVPMSSERHEQIKKSLGELVDLRNELVHHLIELFDVSVTSGCRDASSHLDGCYDKIDGHCQLLKIWADGLAASQSATSSFVQSKAFEDAFVHGINPDGSVSWERSTIVECLREAETACQKDGWTSLGAAIEFIAKTNRGQTPSRYGCKTWRQVLKQSGQFAVRRVDGSDGVIAQTLYRCLPQP